MFLCQPFSETILEVGIVVKEQIPNIHDFSGSCIPRTQVVVHDGVPPYHVGLSLAGIGILGRRHIVD
eukprot:11924252-Alexandrium_andersonii.AAC.1